MHLGGVTVIREFNIGYLTFQMQYGKLFCLFLCECENGYKRKALKPPPPLSMVGESHF